MSGLAERQQAIFLANGYRCALNSIFTSFYVLELSEITEL
jgi:hypothetical protein